MKAYLASQRSWLVVEALPRLRSRAQPRREAVGQSQGQGAGEPLRRNLDEPIRAARRGAERVRSDEDLLFGFLRATGLSLCVAASTCSSCTAILPVTYLSEDLERIERSLARDVESFSKRGVSRPVGS